MTADDYLRNVSRCGGCGERWCMEHREHWADCICPGPHVNCDGVGEPLPQEEICDDCRLPTFTLVHILTCRAEAAE